MSRMPLSRRTMLRGLGATIALPLLDAMLPRTALAAGPTTAAEAAGAAAGAAVKSFPKRMLCFYIPNGTIPNMWDCEGEGADFKLSHILEPLEAFRNDMLVLDGLACDKAKPNGDGPGDHARAMSAFLTGTQPFKTGGTSLHTGVSLDQVIAQKIGQSTRFPSLELGLEYGRQEGICDSGYSCIYSNNLSWRTPESPAPKEVNPRVLFDRLFGGAGNREMSDSDAQREMYNQSILDYVMSDAKDLNKKLGSGDKHRMDEYMTSIRDVERRLAQPTMPIPAELSAGMTRPTRIPETFTEHYQMMADLLAIALQGDLTRVSTLIFGVEGSRRAFPEIGVVDEHHAISHHKRDPKMMDQHTQINRFHIEQLAYFVKKLKTIKEGEGTLLDNTMLLYGGGCKDGNQHSHFDLPVLLFGKGGGTISPGRRIIHETNTPIANLYMTMLENMGVQVDSFGDSTGKLTGLNG